MAYKHLWIYAAFVSDCLVRKPSHGRVACQYLTKKITKQQACCFCFSQKQQAVLIRRYRLMMQLGDNDSVTT